MIRYIINTHSHSGITSARPQLWNLYMQCCFTSTTLSTLSTIQQQYQQQPSCSQQWGPITYATILQSCIKTNQPHVGKSLHCHIFKRGCCLDLFAYNILLNMYVKAGFFRDARDLFDEMSERNVVSFVTLIQGFCQDWKYDEAVGLFSRLHREGHELNGFVFTTVLKLLVSMERAELGWVVHGCLYKLGHERNAFVGTALIDAYSVCGNVEFARGVFDGVVEKDMVSWTGMVACYADNECFLEAVELFSYMRMTKLKPNSFTFASVIKACVGIEAIHVGKSVHACVLKTCYEMDPYVSTALLDMYTKLGDVEDARGVFDEIPKDDVIPWSFMIARYSQSDHCIEAIELFLDMRKTLVMPNQFTFSSVLQACASIEALKLGMQIHSFVLKVGLISDVFVSNALMDVYAKCGDIDESENIFMESENNNDVSWNTIIVGHVQSGDSSKALHIFMNMRENQFQPTGVTYSSALRACASIAALEPGVQIHSLIVKSLYDLDAAVVNALIDMYAKCGSIKDAHQVFESTNKQNIITWNTMISAYSMHGLGNEALKVFEEMRRLKIAPNQLTFVGVLSACSNTGSLDLGQDYLNLMQQNFGIEPCMEHYTCMVSLLGRRGYIDRALNLIDEIPYEPSVMVWRALLGACVVHKNIEVGIISAQHVLEIEPYDETAYVLLSNIYASTKRWDNVASIRKNMKKKRVKKEPGLSWIQYQGIVHYFTVGDCSHPDLRLINGMLEWLNKKTKSVGYTPNHDVILLDVEDDEKSRLLWVHSERLALAFALVRTPSGTPIRIIKNLRICIDCHAALKFISNIVGREIIVRDINRFHHFADGSCSCGDYW